MVHLKVLSPLIPFTQQWGFFNHNLTSGFRVLSKGAMRSPFLPLQSPPWRHPQWMSTESQLTTPSWFEQLESSSPFTSLDSDWFPYTLRPNLTPDTFHPLALVLASGPRHSIIWTTQIIKVTACPPWQILPRFPQLPHVLNSSQASPV